MTPLNPPARIVYKNWKGETSTRTIVPDRVYYGSTEWHPKEQWFLRAYDVMKDQYRDFALSDISEWESM